MELYKYTTAENVKRILNSQKLRFTQPGAFNDPFDTVPYVKGLVSLEHMEKSLENICSNDSLMDLALIDFCEKTYGCHPNYEQIEILKQKISKTLKNENNTIQKLIWDTTNKEGFQKDQIRQFQNHISNHYGVFCLTDKATDLIMWANYAERHTGVVIKFNVDAEFFVGNNSQLLPSLKKIQYVDIRPKLEASIEDLNSNSEIKSDYFSKYFFSKGKNWEIESEWRVIKELSKHSATGLYKDDYEIHLFEFPINSLKEIYFGCRMDCENKKEIRNLLDFSKYNNIEVKEVILDEVEYRLHLKSGM